MSFKTPKTAEAFFAENIDFDESENDRLEKRAQGWRAFAIAGWTVGVIGIVAAASLSHLHEFIPVLARVDVLTGNADVHVGKERIDMADPKNERMMLADLIRYTRAREGFTRAESENNYLTVYVMSEPGIRGAFDEEYRPERNPNALLNKLSAKDQIKLENISVSFLPSDSPRNRVAQVRYDKERRIGANEATTQRYVSTFTFTYDPAAIPTSAEGITANFAGFQALNYRRDKETEEARIAVAAAPQPAGVFPTVFPMSQVPVSDAVAVAPRVGKK